MPKEGLSGEDGIKWPISGASRDLRIGAIHVVAQTNKIAGRTALRIGKCAAVST